MQTHRLKFLSQVQDTPKMYVANFLCTTDTYQKTAQCRLRRFLVPKGPPLWQETSPGELSATYHFRPKGLQFARKHSKQLQLSPCSFLQLFTHAEPKSASLLEIKDQYLDALQKVNIERKIRFNLWQPALPR